MTLHPPASLTLRLLTMLGMAARLGLEQVLTFAGIRTVVESFFSSLKQELVYTPHFDTRPQARSALFEYIEVFYNRQRRHSTLGYVSPAEYEQSA
jgi:transposase InsO family protein